MFLNLPLFLGLCLVQGSVVLSAVVSHSGPQRRETQVQTYSTLPQDFGQPPPGPSFQQPQPSFQNFAPEPNFPSFEQGPNFFPQQGQPGFGPSAFDGSNNELVPATEEGPGLISTLLESTGLSSLFARMSEMFSGLSELLPSSSMSRIMMGAMALPVLLPMAAVPLGVGAMMLMSFPILQLTLPGIRRSLRDGATLTHSVLTSEQCVERLSCNLGKRFGKRMEFLGRLEKSENGWLSRVSKSVKAGRSEEDCQKYLCSPLTRMQNMVRSLVMGQGQGQEQT